MLKHRIAIGFALFAGTLTLLGSIFQDVRFMTVFYRTVVSVAIFGGAGFLIGIMAEKLLREMLAGIKSKGGNIDIISEPQQPGAEEGSSDSGFSPFTPDMVERITRSQ